TEFLQKPWSCARGYPWCGNARTIGRCAQHQPDSPTQPVAPAGVPEKYDLTAVVGLFDITGWLEVLDIECIPCIREDCGTCATQALRSTLFRHLNSLLK